MSTAGAKWWQKPAFALLTLVYFLYFNLNSLWTRLAADDMMNMATYWRQKPLRVVLHPFMPWRGDYRPVAAYYYLPLLDIFGLNPFPYHAVMFALLLANAYLTYRFARLAGCSELPAGIAALLVCYHAGLSVVYYSTAFIYDVLCFTFFLGALLCYMRVRSAGRMLSPRDTGMVVLLHLFALGSKEMALTIPLILLAWELVYYPPAWQATQFLAWLRGPARVALYCAAINLVYLYGKAFGPDPMMRTESYRPHLSLHRIFAFEIASMRDLFFLDGGLNSRSVVMMWLVTGFLAFRRRRPVLRFAWAFLMITPIPLALLEGRSGGCLYIPFAGWALFAAVPLVDFAGAIARLLAQEPLFRHAGPRALTALVLCIAIYAWARENQVHKLESVQHAMDDVGRLTGITLKKMDALNPHVKPGSHVAFMHDPFPDWDMLFIAELWFRDRSLTFHILNKTPLPPHELDKMTVFDFQGDRIVRITGGE